MEIIALNANKTDGGETSFLAAIIAIDIVKPCFATNPVIASLVHRLTPWRGNEACTSSSRGSSIPRFIDVSKDETVAVEDFKRISSRHLSQIDGWRRFFSCFCFLSHFADGNRWYLLWLNRRRQLLSRRNILSFVSLHRARCTSLLQCYLTLHDASWAFSLDRLQHQQQAGERNFIYGNLLLWNVFARRMSAGIPLKGWNIMITLS